MTIKTVVIKGTKLPLPKSWRDAEVLVRQEPDTLLVKRILKPQETIFDTTEQKAIRRLGKRISTGTIRAAVRWARSRA